MESWNFGFFGAVLVQKNNNKVFFTSYLNAHECFSHPGQSAMENLRKQYPELIPSKPENFHCPPCLLSKSTHKSEKSSQKHAKNPLEIIHSDLSGKFSVDSLGGNDTT